MNTPWHRSFHVDPDDPQPGERVELVNPDGEHSGMETKVREILGSDGDIHEIRDDRGQTIQITWVDETWVQIPEA